jgi:tripartite-type tricarboxylate transporter receptor subunit TctC
MVGKSRNVLYAGRKPAMFKLATYAVAFAAAVAAMLPRASEAQSPAEFYKGKTVYLQIGSGVGGGFDSVGRLFARHIGKHIPGNPNIVPQNVPGGGSLQLANQFANTSPRDGTVFGILNNGAPMTPLLTPDAAKFDPRKFLWIGTPIREAFILISWYTANAKTVDDLFKVETVAGSTGPGGANYDFPFLTNAIIGTKFKIVTGYSSSNETKLAMERREIDAYAGVGLAALNEYADEIKNGRIKALAAFGMKKNSKVLDVPLLPIGKTEEEHQLFQLMYAREDFGRPLVAPPDLPADRIAALRQAFADTLKDPEFIADAKKLNLDLDPVFAPELTQLTDRLFATPPSVVKRMQGIMAQMK